MSKKYLIGFELYLMEDSCSEDDKKLSFELLKEIMEFLMKYYNVRNVRFIERSEATFSLTIEPKKVKLTSTGNDKVFKKITKNFEDIYSKLCVKFGCKEFLNFVSPIYFTIKPIHPAFAIRDERLSIYRECFKDLDADLYDAGMGHYREIYKEDIKKCRENYERYVVNNLSKVNLDSDHEDSFYKMIQLAIKDELKEPIGEQSGSL